MKCGRRQHQTNRNLSENRYLCSFRKHTPVHTQRNIQPFHEVGYFQVMESSSPPAGSISMSDHGQHERRSIHVSDKKNSQKVTDARRGCKTTSVMARVRDTDGSVRARMRIWTRERRHLFSTYIYIYGRMELAGENIAANATVVFHGTRRKISSVSCPTAQHIIRPHSSTKRL